MLRENGLTIVLALLFLASLVGHALTGWRAAVAEDARTGHALQSLAEYIKSGEFVGSVGENWESEFLQMLVFVYLSTFLYQRGSPESKSPDEHEEVDEASHSTRARAPWPVRRGGMVARLYAHSLGLAFLALFLVSFALHLSGSLRNYREETGLEVSLAQYFASPRFWFESFQNWQSEFLSVGSLVLFTVFLRQRGSPQSKPVAATNREQE